MSIGHIPAGSSWEFSWKCGKGTSGAGLRHCENSKRIKKKWLAFLNLSSNALQFCCHVEGAKNYSILKYSDHFMGG